MCEGSYLGAKHLLSEMPFTPQSVYILFAIHKICEHI